MDNTFRVEITRVTSWKDVLDSARFTQRKQPLGKEPSDSFKKKIVKAMHSPLRCLMFNIDLYNIPYYVSVHLVRHIHAQPFVSTSRPDIDGNQLPREEQKKTDLVNMRLFVNAEEIINISKVRRCRKAERETIKFWNCVIDELRKQEPILAGACVPNCVFRNGICPEIECCGFNKTQGFTEMIDKYISNFETE